MQEETLVETSAASRHESLRRIQAMSGHQDIALGVGMVPDLYPRQAGVAGNVDNAFGDSVPHFCMVPAEMPVNF